MSWMAATAGNLHGTIERERDRLGVFITYEELSVPMLLETSSAGYTSSISAKDHSRRENTTVRQLLDELTGNRCCPCSPFPVSPAVARQS